MYIYNSLCYLPWYGTIPYGLYKHSLPQVSLSHVKSKKNESRRRLKKQKKAICGEIYDFLAKNQNVFHEESA